MGDNYVSDRTFLAGMRDLAAMAKQMAASLRSISDSMKGLQSDLRALRKHLEQSPRPSILGNLPTDDTYSDPSEEMIHD